MRRAFLLFFEVNLERTTLEVFEQFAKPVVRAPEVLERHMVAGGFDYLVKTRVGDMNAYRLFSRQCAVVAARRAGDPNLAVKEAIKSATELPV